MDLKKAQQKIAAWASLKPLVRRALIYGSRVRGEHHANSDLDIAVELDVPVDKDDTSGGRALWKFDLRWQSELQALLPDVEVQLEQYISEKATPTVSRGLRQSSILVYQKPATAPNS